ncbi:MAG TPA: hypothetical protein PLK37_06305 [Terricaulis sp.]|nr:hypothetical protein [Terricaulis sp.]
MVSSIVPGAIGSAGALGVDSRLTRSPGQAQAANGEAARSGDRVEVGGAASWSAARESVKSGLSQVHQALAAGHEAQSMLAQAQALARSGGTQEDLATLMRNYEERLSAILGSSGGVAAGDDIAIFAEPGAAPVVVQGADMRLKADPQESDVLALSAQAKITDADLNQALQRSFEKLQGAMDKLFASARSLEAHQGFLNAAEAAHAANADLDADAARLVALQVAQGLAAGGAIANVEPQAVLALFKA